MDIRELQVPWKIPKSKICKNLNTRKLPDLQHYNANAIKDDRKAACILSLMGCESYGLLKNLAAPKT